MTSFSLPLVIILLSPAVVGLPIQVGVGMCMEGIEQNPVVYDLMAEMAFHHATLDVEVSHWPPNLRCHRIRALH